MTKSGTLPIIIIPIEEDGSHLILNAAINSRQARLLIDTGASRSVFDLSRVTAFVESPQLKHHEKLSTGLGTNSMETKSVEFENLTLGELVIHHFEAILLDLSHVNESYRKLDLLPIDGVIGNDILAHYTAEISFLTRELKLYWD